MPIAVLHKEIAVSKEVVAIFILIYQAFLISRLSNNKS